MKKRLLASVMASILSITALAGCTKSSAETDTNIVTEIKEPVTIEMWHYMTGKQDEVLNEIITDFNNTNGKQITVKAISQGGIADLNKKVIAAAQSNTLPAIINVYPDLATGLIEQGKIADLAPYINHSTIGMKDDLSSDFVKTFIDETSQWKKDAVYGIPMTKSTEVIYVNTTLLEKLGYKLSDLDNLTYDKLVEISKKCKEELNIPGFGFDSSSNAFISSLKSDNKDFVELNGTINVDNAWTKEYMDFFKDNVEKGYFRVAGEDKFLSGVFSNQQLLMYQGSSAGYSFIKTNDAFTVGVTEVPAFEGKDRAVIQQGASLFVTTDVTPEAQYAAYEFIKFVTNTENTAKFSVSTGYLPVRKSAADTQIVKDAIADKTSLYGSIYPIAERALGYAYFTPAVNNAQSARSTVAEKFDSYVTGGIKDIDTFIKDTTTQVETSIQRQ